MAGMTELRGSETDDFWSWRDAMYRFVQCIDPEAMEAFASMLYALMLERGYTAVGEFHYLHHQADGTPYADPAELSLRVVGAARRVGVGITHLPVLYQHSDFGRVKAGVAQRPFINDLESLMKIVASVRRVHGDDPGCRVGLAPHSLRAVDVRDIPRAYAALSELDASAPFHLHISEQEAEVAACLEMTGRRPVQLLAEHLQLSERCCLVHATHLSDEEVALVARSEAVVGLCPTTEANLGDGVFMAPEFMAAGGLFGVGSDSHITVDPCEELRLLEYVHRLGSKQRNVLLFGDSDCEHTGASLYRRALAGGARALGQDVGRIAEGARADLVVLDPDHPSLYGRRDDALLDTWVFASLSGAVREVWTGGQQRVKAGRHVDFQEISAAYRRHLARVLSL